MTPVAAGVGDLRGDRGALEELQVMRKKVELGKVIAGVHGVLLVLAAPAREPSGSAGS